jgi:hypothetical protein
VIPESVIDAAIGLGHTPIPMKTPFAFFLLFVSVQSFAMKNRLETFPQPCAAVWKASVAIGKTEQYRIISISREEQIMSLAAGGAWWGERIISLSLAPGGERGCTVTVQSRYSGLEHSDGPDLLARIHVQLLREELGVDSAAFQKYKDCVGSPAVIGNEAKCEVKLRRRLDADEPAPAVRADPPLWNKQSN